MDIKRTTFYIIFISVFFSLVNLVNANLEITEVMYDLDGTDAGREWIEVKNINDDKKIKEIQA